MENQQEVDAIFSTRDLTLAATLTTLKFGIVGIDYQIEGNKPTPIGYFKFKNTPQLREARQRYTQALLTVEPKLFITNMHSLKAEIVGAFTNPHLKTFDGSMKSK